MADGIVCGDCGRQESDHLVPPSELEDPEKKRRGYRFSVIGCGFRLSRRGKKEARVFEKARLREGEYWVQKEICYANTMGTFAVDFLRWARLAASQKGEVAEAKAASSPKRSEHEVFPRNIYPGPVWQEHAYPPPKIFRGKAA